METYPGGNEGNDKKIMIPYGRQTVDEDDINAVVDVLRSDWLTTGPKVTEFEKTFADFVGAKFAVAVSSGTAALHASMFALDIGQGDEVIVPSMTFAATANCVVFQGGTPVFADVDPDTLLIDPIMIEGKVTDRTKAVLAVDFAGQPCDYDALRKICDRRSLALVADGCHALGAEYKGRKVGSLVDMTVFSFHPVKHITTGEGGMITTDHSELDKRFRLFRNHGIDSDFRKRDECGSWYYEMIDLGHNYRLTDLQCALGISQLRKLSHWIIRRQEIAWRYDSAFANLPAVEPLGLRDDVRHAYHLYVIRLNLEKLRADRTDLFAALRLAEIGVNVHYIPVHLHPFYRKRFDTGPGMCPVAEAAYERLLSLPMFHGMTDDDVDRVIQSVIDVIGTYSV
jgi:perosamine synthetase